MKQSLNTELRLGYVLNSSTVLEILQRRFSEEVALRIKANDAIQIGDPLGVGTSFHFAERDLEDAVTLLSSLAAVDGAVVLDRRLRIFGFAGEILNTKQVSTDTVRTVSITREVNDSLPLSSFGTRHRSAYRFCCSHPHALAFVISQDGDLRIFASDADGTVLYEGYSPDGWLF